MINFAGQVCYSLFQNLTDSMIEIVYEKEKQKAKNEGFFRIPTIYAR